MSTPDSGRRGTTGGAAVIDGLPGDPARPASRHLGLALIVIATAQLMVVLDATIVNVALPDIQHALGFSGSGLEWVVNAYALTFGGLLLLGGRAGDVLGRRRVFIAGIILFSVASLLGGFATTQVWLLARPRAAGRRRRDRRPDRVVAGRHHVPGRPAAQPGDGRLRGDEHRRRRGRPDGRRPADLVRVLALGVVRQCPDRDRRRTDRPRALGESERHPRRFDLPGAITCTLGLAALVYGLTSAATTPNGVSHWGDTKVVASLTAALVLLASFVIIESRSKHALMPLRIFRNRNRSGAYLIMLCVGTALFGMFFFLTIFVQTVWGYSPLKTGVAYLPMVAMIMVMAGLSAQLVPRIGARPLLLAASAIASGGMFWLSRINEHSHLHRRPARPDAGHRGGPGHAVHAGHPGRAVQGRGPRRGPGLQPGQHRPAGRRLDRAGRAGHRRLDRRRQHRPDARRPPPRPPRSPPPGRATRCTRAPRRRRRRSTTTRWRSASRAGSRCRP